VKRKIFVEGHLPSEELESLIRHGRYRRILERLIFIKALYDGKDTLRLRLKG
jgi:hypothetical protein